MNDEEKVREVIAKLDGAREEIERFASRINQDYDSLMAAADCWLSTGDYTYDNSESYKSRWDQFPEFWDLYEKVRGTKDPDGNCFFTCSC